MQLPTIEQMQKVVNVFSPAAGSPSSPLETTQWLRSLQPSLMPRTSLHQGAASAMVILTARAASQRVDRLADRLTPNHESLSQRVAVRAAVAGAGYTLRTLPDADDTAWPAAFARLGGELIEGGAAGGIIFELMSAPRRRTSSTRRGAELTTVSTAAAFAFALYKSRTYLKERQAFFTEDFDQLSLNLPRTLAVTAGVTAAGTGMGYGHRATRRGLERFFGAGPLHTVIARGVNEALWAAALTGIYWAGISRIGQANEKIDPGYAEPPTSPLVSGSADSLCPFEELGQQGRRFVTDVIPPELIESTMGVPAAAHPIRIFVGYNQQPLYTSGRAETALEEMERTGAYDRGTILLVSPTGTGWVDHTMIEATEFFTLGDLATVCIQYGRFPSFLSLQKVRAGRRQFRNLVWGVRQRVRAMPVEQRPRILVFGESLGAWASSDVIMSLGVDGLEHYGVDRALWFGMPQLARWSAAGLYRPGQLTPEGTVGVFDRWEELEQLLPDERDALKIVQLSHDNDPITLVTPTLLYRAPDWLGEVRGRNVPAGQRWYPIVTGVQTMIDAANAMRNSPGDFRSTGHDYRADTARFVAEGYRLDYTEEQLGAVESELRRLEKERAHRISPPADAADLPPAPAQRTEHHLHAPHLPKLRGSRTRGADWSAAVTEITSAGVQTARD